MFVAGIANTSPTYKFAYDWTVSAGEIIKGQGTSILEVSTTKELQGKTITATVKVTGVHPICNESVSETALIAALPSGPHWLDEFGDSSRDDLRARIDNFYIRIQNTPDSEGIVIAKFTRKDSVKEKTRHLDNILSAIRWMKKDVTRISFLILEDDYRSTALGVLAPASNPAALGIDASKLIKGEQLKQKIKDLFITNK